jgi:ABC-type transport system involved in Fe-S cluster assembly fused permease/ATPase subunit
MDDIEPVKAGKPILAVFDYLYPLIVVFYFLVAITFSACTLQKPKRGKYINKLRIAALIILLTAVFGYVGQGIVYLARAIIQRGWWAPDHMIINVLALMLVWGCLFLRLLATPNPVWHPFLGCWVVGLGFEISLFLLASVEEKGSYFDKAVHLLQITRITCFLALTIFGLLLSTVGGDEKQTTDEERQPLLNGSASGSASTNQLGYGGSLNDNSGSDDDDDDGEEASNDNNKEIKEQQRKRLEEEGGWWGYLKSFGIFLPYLWPSKNWFLQGCLVVMALGLVADRLINVLTPRQVGILTDKLNEYAGTGKLPWKEFLIWLGLRVIGGRSGYVVITDLAKYQIQLYSGVQISELAFKHVMGLSMEFHSNKDTGEILRSMQQAQSLTDLIDMALFSIAPVCFDLVIALGFTTYLFNAYAAFILVVAGVIYVYLGIWFTEWIRTKRQVYRNKDREQFKTLTRSIGNWETVSYFNRGQYEESRFKNSNKAFVKAENGYMISSEISWAAQSLVMSLGMMAASFLAVYQISIGQKPVGNFVTLLLYWEELMWPLQVVATSYRRLSSTLIDAERLLQLLRTKPAVEDAPDAKELKITNGRVEFENVNFSYDTRKQTLKNINFVAEPGKTIAFVGETGGGKSTMLKLIFRFYDITGGSIKIDGQDIRKVTIDSLRESLGVVPQDPTLFNESIMDNIRYARLDASEGDVQEVCKSAAVHDKIMTFPDKYKSKVGERGVKLSGGEKQRVAIARVLLKNPQIVLLDEATSAVDSSTEEQIQEAFRKLSTGRTTFVIAHRLSTIMDADVIFVVDHGEIIERGTHNELLLKGGKYFELWTKQTEGKRSKAPSIATTPPEVNQPLILINDSPPETYSSELAQNLIVKDAEESARPD